VSLQSLIKLAIDDTAPEITASIIPPAGLWKKNKPTAAHKPMHAVIPTLFARSLLIVLITGISNLLCWLWNINPVSNQGKLIADIMNVGTAISMLYFVVRG
jgi:hypothetical protein